MTPLPSAPADALDGILQRHRHDATRLLQILIDAQDLDGWLPPPMLTRIAAALDLPRARVEGVAGFYSFLHTASVGRYRVLFSDNITDRMLGNAGLMDALCAKLWVEPGKRSEDGLVSIATTSCTGLCDQGPALLVNGRAIGQLDHRRINAIAELIRQQTPLERWPAEFFRVTHNIRRRDALLNLDMAPGAALSAVLALGREGWLTEMEASRLRGRGGAGFTTSVKWLSARNAPGAEKVIVCNADEGEPGTFKDRVLLAGFADLVFEGMTLAAWAVGARQGLLYLRGEYRWLRPHLDAVLARRRSAGLLGPAILGERGFDFDIDIHLGAGAYVCGEETALIESLEGKRGTPRIRPPFPVTHGYLGRPTVVNNVETLAKTCLIALQGGAAFAATGTAQSAGTKLLSVSGDCAAPGIYEYPFGVTLARVLEDCGASDTQAVQVGGAAGLCLAGYEFQRRIAYEDVPTAGAFMVFDATRDLFEVARAFVHFFAHESCGFCTPCRVGTALLKGFMDKLADGHGAQADLADIEWLDRLLKNASHCGLGSAAPNPVIDTLQKFRPAYERRLLSLDFEPAFDLDGALAEARRLTARNDPGAHLATHEETRE
ncbi:MAG TPA: NAD(P)H-dependent oxidoreductase subunit E [Zoogloea sp.]|uniref:NAD(P)H-dependent oxidoreductase subunit E n=1 Tax=Zoogloea sp. TaxID=49181 RepID=UPI002BBCF612|nr:NAD(P)H-dependent oxidoreductase subunit E [Zoogloea sp.]HMV18607.1 NAD(P)H-dependent oxidoreductase subunit E [Rhodocyclaceae bacterium]HMW51553.1 NAD(P)H-dependent oxidoreductase subunit E [Rhodocyclaceae bacterium]HMY49382.1 NAD(P)H-dependent oxidoreductase subunit E [Rhodocyclaceae bacterium]HMZ76188.1 NAD(P)H-dependent oxidoreductase subunit E [Rhodocyclaceae bacterium]HNA67954.1 NAD(P)H-dependent oxidoreductase subunit E [Rhodocyclaceae bacterium]